MPQVVAAAVAFVASVFTVANVVAFAVRALTFIALNYASQALQGKPKAGGWRGDSLQVSLDPNSPRTWLVGQTATAGSLVTFQTWGNKNEYIILIFALADHPCQALVGAWNNGVRVTINADGSVQEYYADGHHNCWVTFVNGSWNQAADSELIANSSGRWTTNDRGRGVTYVKVKARYNEKAFTSGLSTLFQFVWEVQGAALYDRRLDGTAGGTGTQRSNDASTWTYSTNAAVIVDNFLRGVSVEDTSTAVATRARDRFMGLSLTNTDLPAAENLAAANSCDETVSLKAGGTEARYRASGVIGADLDPATALSDLLAAEAGKLVTAPGRWFQLPGVTQTSLRTLTDDDFRIDGPLTYQQDFPLDELVNAVYGRFADPTNIYQGINLPPRLSPTDETTDGGRKPETLDLSRVSSSTQGQRIQEINRRRSRRQKRLQVAVGPEHIDLEAGDWITINSARFGWTLVFEVVQTITRLDDRDFFMVVLDLREIDSAIYSWTPATDELSALVASTLPSAVFTGSTATGVSIAATTITSGSSTNPALAVTLDAPVDPIAVGVSIEYRAQGLPAGAPQTLTRYFDVNPALYVTGNTLTITFADGVVGGFIYEARANIVTRPPRDPIWSTWAATAAATSLIGNSSINNSAISISSGAINGIGTGNGTAVANSSISISGGAIGGIGTGNGTAVANSAITISAGVLSGIGTAGVTVDNSLVTATGIGAVKTDATNAPASILNSSITVSGGAIGGIGTGNGTAVANSAITISAGVLSGIGTAGVTVDNSLVTATGIGAVKTDATNAPASILNSSITISGGAIGGIGTGNGTAVANSSISISSAGVLSGAGGGTVTLTGLGAGTVATLSSIATGNINSNAVTQTTGAYTQAAVTTSGTTTVQTITFTATGGPCVVNFGASLVSNNGGTDVATMSVVRVQGASTTVWTSGTTTFLQGGSCASSLIDTPAAGSVTYNLTTASSTGTFPTVSNRTLSAVELKR